MWEHSIHQGNSALARGLHAEAAVFFETALKGAGERIRSDSLWAEANRGYAKALLGLGRIEAAEEAARRALGADEEFWGAECLQVADDLTLLGESLRKQCRFNEAITAFENASTIHSHYHEDYHPQTLYALARLLLIYLESGIDDGYSALHARTFSAYQKNHPTGNWAAMLDLPGLAIEYVPQDKITELESIIKRESSQLEHTLGSTHHEVKAVLDCLNNVPLTPANKFATRKCVTARQPMPTLATDALSHAEELALNVPPVIALGVVEKIFMGPFKRSAAPVGLQNGRWQLISRDLNSLSFLARLSIIQNGATEPLEVKVVISDLPGLNTCKVNFYWRIGSSSVLSIVRSISQYIIAEIRQTFAVLPADFGSTYAMTILAAYEAPAIEVRPQPVPIKAWPSPQQYNEAIQNPAYCFEDQDLKESTADLDALGLPRPLSGSFATVYRLSNSTGF